jgi:hypothetical protein
MNAVELQLTAELWKNIMKRKQLEMDPFVDAENVILN